MPKKLPICALNIKERTPGPQDALSPNNRNFLREFLFYTLDEYSSENVLYMIAQEAYKLDPTLEKMNYILQELVIGKTDVGINIPNLAEIVKNVENVNHQAESNISKGMSVQYPGMKGHVALRPPNNVFEPAYMHVLANLSDTWSRFMFCGCYSKIGPVWWLWSYSGNFQDKLPDLRKKIRKLMDIGFTLPPTIVNLLTSSDNSSDDNHIICKLHITKKKLNAKTGMEELEPTLFDAINPDMPINNPLLLRELLLFSTTEFACENILFMLGVAGYKKFPTLTKMDYLYKTFVQKKSPLEVNLQGKSVVEVGNQVNSCTSRNNFISKNAPLLKHVTPTTITAFDSANKDAFANIADTWSRFIFTGCLQKTGNSWSLLNPNSEVGNAR